MAFAPGLTMASCFSFACLGCGVGIGAAVSSMRQSRGHAHVAPLLRSRTEGRLNDAQHHEPCIIEAADAQCHWLNSLVSILWPRIDQFLKILVETQIQPAINEALPHVMKDSVVIKRCSLGEATPSFSNFKVKERTNNAIVLELGVEVLSNLDVQIKAMHLPLGIREFLFRGVLTVVLEPPANAPPFFGGVEVYLVNPPELDFDFTGAANIADLKIVKSVLQKTIRGQLKKLLVVPARIAIDLLPDDDADEAELKCPEPIGALRVLVKSANDLRGDDISFTGKRTSDPYVTIEVGQEMWKSSVVKATCNPVWEHGNVHDFMVYDSGQNITFEVYDWDRVGADDLLGVVKEIPVEHFALSGQVMDEKLEILDDDGLAGSLVISTRWFTFTDQVPVRGIPPAVARGPHQLFLAIKIEDAHELPPDSAAPFTVHVVVGKDYSCKTDPSRPPDQVKSHPDLTKVCLKLHQKGMPMEDIAGVAGLPLPQVSMIVKQQQNPAALARTEEALKRKQGAVHPVWNENVRLLLPWTEDIINEKVCIELHDSHSRRVGARVELPLAEAVGKELHGPFSILPGAAIRGVLSTKWFCLP